MPRRSPLESPSIGTSSTDLIQGCSPTTSRPADPPPPPVPPALALAFSGGGFRATLSALGVLRFVADAGLLDRIRYFSSVSGGSVAHGVVACGYERVRDGGFTADAVD